MERPDIEAILLADAPEALVELCGVTLLERLLRILQRLDFRHAFVLSATTKSIAAELAKPSWARQNVNVDLVAWGGEALTRQTLLESVGLETARWLIIPAGVYCDARLLEALRDQNTPAVLIDSDPPEIARPLIEKCSQTTRGRLCGPALLTRNLVSTFSPRAPVFDELRRAIEEQVGAIDPNRPGSSACDAEALERRGVNRPCQTSRKIGFVDAATQPDYIVSMRRRVRSLCFPAPSPTHHTLADCLVLDTAQNGTLDLPACVHAPIENWIISRLCQTRITPNQITIFGFVIGCGAAVAFAMGHLGLGTVAALIFGIVDGLDGKQARVKVETTEHGEWEHGLDYLIENLWWTALAFHLWRSGQFSNAFYFLALLIGSDLLNRLANRQAKIATGRQLDDVSPFDRAFRLIAGRRNIYVWMLAVGLVLGAVEQTYAAICGWAAATAAVHLLRCAWLRTIRRSAPV